MRFAKIKSLPSWFLTETFQIKNYIRTWQITPQVDKKKEEMTYIGGSLSTKKEREKKHLTENK